ncbi:AAA family ATPase [Mucilaginibacter achroorhodeus]|nr:AAA family ATPase [Mucilaginibacter achroorhodeus]
MEYYYPTGRPEKIDRIRAESRGMIYCPTPPPDPEPAKEDPIYRYLFHPATGKRWMDLGEQEPVLKMLFGEFWHEGEIAILLADTNVGKSVLAVQIANSIAEGRPIAPFGMDADPAKVLYVDFELGTRQFYKRYTHAGADYNFNNNFLRAQFTPERLLANGIDYQEEQIIDAIEFWVMELKATVLIIDNITCLRAGMENATAALNLMKKLKTLRADYNLSILVLAHTPKRRNPCAPISADDMLGSKLMINLADSAFAIGTSATQPGLRYLKQIKQRSSAQLYGEDNVCLCRITKPHNFLQMDFEGHSPERQHLSSRTYHQKALATRVPELAARGYSQRLISKELGISLGMVNKLMKK